MRIVADEEMADTLHPLLPSKLQRAREFACLKEEAATVTASSSNGVFVAPHFLLTMPLIILMVVIQPFATVKLGTLQLS